MAIVKILDMIENYRGVNQVAIVYSTNRKQGQN